MNIPYYLFIFPVEKIIELFYLFIFRLFHNPFLSIIGVCISVNILTLPLYFKAEKYQNLERDIKKKLKPKIDSIKSIFSGDTRFLTLQTFYRQNNYHPIFALRSSLSLIIQIPFFIAAYTFISKYNIFEGFSLFNIVDLSTPDNLIPGGLNLLPFIMTLVNCISCIIYSKGFSFSEKFQLYGIAGIFLILLYNSPAGLVIYWTVNNIFSLIKNLTQRINNPFKYIYISSCIFALIINLYLIFIHNGYLLKRIIIILLFSIVFVIPVLKKYFIALHGKFSSVSKITGINHSNKIFLYSILSIFILMGFSIPSALIASSVHEFSFIENYSSPYPFIFTVLLQSAGLFIIWPFIVYCMLSKKGKVLFSMISVFFLFNTLINIFLFPGSYGFLTNTLILSNPGTWSSYLGYKLLNLLVILISIPVVIVLFLFQRKRNILMSLHAVIIISIILLGTINFYSINKEYTILVKKADNSGLTDNIVPVYSLSKIEKNVVVIMLDRAISGFLPEIIKEKPEINEIWDGFTYYPNCVSFSGWTLWGIPSLAGGYSYTPLNMQSNPKTLEEKTNEAILLLPRIFSENNYLVTVTDPLWANFGWTPDLSIFDPYHAISSDNINTKYTNFWMKNHPDVFIFSVTELLKDKLFRFSIFKSLPMIIRNFFYDRGDWLTVDKENNKMKITKTMIGSYAVLDYLPILTKIDFNTNGSFLMIFNELTHEPAFLQAPDYIPANKVTNRGISKHADNSQYHVVMASFLLLGKWFSYLKENEVYNNTRIIVISDHGLHSESDTKGFFLPDGSRLEKYVSLLLIKDFCENGNIKTDNSFMTQADLPLLALKDLVSNPVNPFSGQLLHNEKENGIFITTSDKFYHTRHGKNKYNIDKNEWLFVKDNIFNPNNWAKAEK